MEARVSPWLGTDHLGPDRPKKPQPANRWRSKDLSFKIQVLDIHPTFGGGYRNPKHTIITPNAAQWRAFRQALDDLKVGQWQEAYPTHGTADSTQESFVGSGVRKVIRSNLGTSANLVSHPMQNSRKPIFLILGCLFLLGAPLSYVGAGVYAYVQPRLFSAATGFRVLFPAADAPRLQGSFQRACQQYPARAAEPLATDVKLQRLGTPNEYQITAIDENRLTAAYTANGLTRLVVETLSAASEEEERRVITFQKATILKTPSFPNVQLIMTVGIVAASLFGAIGVTFLLMAAARRTSNGAKT